MRSAIGISSSFPGARRWLRHAGATAAALPASQGSFSPDGQSIAYQPITKWEPAWKHYDGGQTTPIWIVNLKTLDLVKVPRENSNDSNPVWVGEFDLFPLRPQRACLALPLRHRIRNKSARWCPTRATI